MSSLFRAIRLILPLLLLLWCVGVGVTAGRAHQKTMDAAAMLKKDAALREAAVQLSHAADALRQQNAENKRLVAAAREATQREAAALQAAQAEKVRLARESQAFERRLQQAQRRPDCRMLLETDVRQVCGNLH